mmetsp:Transcript_14936/g.26848  ORF Transcript_14936/g.26848 Transcript_14936/m.26848 type:complete len:175 (+) Transcript_14936:107-631(+)
MISRASKGVGWRLRGLRRSWMCRRGMSSELPRKGWPVQMKDEVQWGDQDAYMHVNNTQYYRWWESAHIKYLRKLGIMMIANAKDPSGAIIARSECNFKLPVEYPDTVTVCCRCSRIGNTSLDIEYLLQNGKGEECATGAATLVLFDYIEEKKYVIDEKMKEMILSLETEAEPSK